MCVNISTRSEKELHHLEIVIACGKVERCGVATRGVAAVNVLGGDETLNFGEIATLSSFKDCSIATEEVVDKAVRVLGYNRGSGRKNESAMGKSKVKI